MMKHLSSKKMWSLLRGISETSDLSSVSDGECALDTALATALNK